MDSHWSLHPRLSDMIVWPFKGFTSTLPLSGGCRKPVVHQVQTLHIHIGPRQGTVSSRIPNTGYTVWDKCGMFIEIWQAKSLAMCALEEKLCLASQFHVNSRGWNAKMVLSVEALRLWQWVAGHHQDQDLWRQAASSLHTNLRVTRPHSNLSLCKSTLSSDPSSEYHLVSTKTWKKMVIHIDIQPHWPGVAATWAGPWWLLVPLWGGDQIQQLLKSSGIFLV